jgi:tetratricopeptide (TPR) repeat protein
MYRTILSWVGCILFAVGVQPTVITAPRADGDRAAPAVKKTRDSTDAGDVDRRSARDHCRRASEYLDRGRLDEAIDEYTEAIRLAPDSEYGFGGRGMAYLGKREAHNAIADLSEAIRLNPKRATFYSLRGSAYLIGRDTNSAIADFTEAIRLNPRLSQPYTGRAIAYERKGEWAKARSDRDRADELLRERSQHAKQKTEQMTERKGEQKTEQAR